MTPKRKPAVVSPIPKVVEVADNEVHMSFLRRFGSARPAKSKSKAGSGAKTVTPLAVFQGDGRYFRAQASSSDQRSYGGDGDSTTGTFAERIGIRRLSYARLDDEESYDHGTHGEASHRIGITRPDYDLEERETPIAPLNLFLEKKETTPTPNLVELDHSETSSDPYVVWNQHGQERSTSRDSADQAQNHVKDDDSIERMIHEATAEGHYLVGSTPISCPKDEIKFSLTKRRGGLNKAMKRASERHVTRPPRPSSERAASHDGVLGAPDASFKIFLLLLNPQAKIFELIQVIYSPSITTIADILSLIPGNATEPALGSLSYIGLCRPKDGVEITDMTLMASGLHCKKNCARIMLGEILVAIPSGFTGERCAKLAVPILKNERIQTLLRRSDPLGIKRKSSRSSSSSSRRSSGSGHHRRSGSHSSTSRVETVKEEPEGSGENSPQIKQALQHAREAAAMANASCPDSSAAPKIDYHRSNNVDHSIHELEHWRSITDFSADTASMNDSVASSIVSTASSYKSGLSMPSRRLPRMSRSSSRRKHRRQQRNYYVPRVVGIALTTMVLRFMFERTATTHDVNAILGWKGLLQFFLVFAIMLKIQMYIRRGHHRAEQIKCPFVRVSLAAAESLHEQFATSH